MSKGFCVITDQNDIVLSISMIPGSDADYLPDCYNMYFPAKGDAVMGEKYEERTMGNWFEKIHDCTNEIRTELRYLGRIIAALETVGNTRLAGDLSNMYENIERAAGDIKQVVSDKINGDFDDSQKAIGNTLKALVSATNKPKTAFPTTSIVVTGEEGKIMERLDMWNTEDYFSGQVDYEGLTDGAVKVTGDIHQEMIEVLRNEPFVYNVTEYAAGDKS